MTLPDVRSDLYTLLERFVLGDRRSIIGQPDDVDASYSIAHALHLLSARKENLAGMLYELRLRVALHFAPIDAIAYDRSSTIPRHRIVRSFLQKQFNRDGVLVEHLARDVSKVLDDWDSSRSRVTGHLETLLSRQGGRCAHCGVALSPTLSSVVGASDYKPYYLDPEELLAPEVDHIEPISGFGTNRLENLQVLCRLCNSGKGDGLGVSVRQEIRYAATPVASIPLHHRMRMFFVVCERDRGQYIRASTGAPFAELSMAKVRAEGGFVRSNLIVSPAVPAGSEIVVEAEP